MNTSIEHSASSSTGASNQPLITVGLLERLNGDEKGDAIVSVRGYEPIWTKFTPSYKLANIYFPEGKADLSKREAVLFEKAEYVFDIYQGKEQSKEQSENSKIDETVLDAIEEAEQEEERKEQERATYIRGLRAEWDSIVNDIDQKLRKFVTYLDGKDSRVVLAAKLENKATLLYTLMEKYSQSMAERMMGMADYISSRLTLLDEIQKQAEREKENRRKVSAERS